MEAPIAASSIPVSSSSDDMNTSADTVTDTPFTGYGNGHPPVTQNEKPSEKRAKPANLPIYLNPSRFTSHFCTIRRVAADFSLWPVYFHSAHHDICLAERHPRPHGHLGPGW